MLCVSRLIGQVAQAHPDGIAVELGQARLRYRELDERANRLAHALRARGVGPETRVAICLPRSLDLVIAMLGVLRAGAAFLPLDPAYPAERLSYMLADAQPVLVISDLDSMAIDAHPTTAPLVAIDPDNLAYVIYTSGSTGQPKGALLTHRGLANLVRNQIRIFALSSRTRVLQFAALSFDASVWETFATLAAGGTLVLAAPAELMPGKELVETLRDRAITLVTLPPSVLGVMRDVELPALATVVSAGEACSPAVAERWRTGRRFINVYGPTESTVCATLGDFAGGSSITIGRPLDGIAANVLDDDLQPVSNDVPGELFIGGVGLARGYHHRASLTAERFVPDPYSPDPGARMYRSGDHVRRLPSGELVFVGRVDDQVKIRGFRVELGEVEAALEAHPDVRKAVVIARGASPSEMRLLAYVVPAQQGLSSADVVASVARRLPAHMVPSIVLVVDAFPMTPAGKIDRPALPDPPVTDAAGAGRVHELSALFAEILELPRVGIDDNFFELGGHSLLAAQLAQRLEELLGTEVPLGLIFDAPTAQELAVALLPYDRAQTIAGLFAEVLELPSVGLDDNFFELGGHSILVAQLVERITEVMGSEVALGDVFDFATPRELATRVPRDGR
ncbi:N/A [soil metagenome]